MADNRFKVKNGLVVDAGPSEVTGSLVAPSITGSLEGSASWALNAVTASYALNGGGGGPSTPTFPYTGSATISGSLTIIESSSPGLLVTGSVVSTDGFTGSLQGTASWANNAITASYVDASNVVGLSLNQISTASVLASVSLGTSSFQVVSQSYTLFSVSNTGNAEAQSMVTQQFTASNAFITNLNIQTLTASIVAYTTGSTIFGDAMTDTHQFTGSVTITGSLQINGNRVVDEFTVIAYSIAL